jgi:hypothetical protein
VRATGSFNITTSYGTVQRTGQPAAVTFSLVNLLQSDLPQRMNAKRMTFDLPITNLYLFV